MGMVIWSDSNVLIGIMTKKGSYSLRANKVKGRTAKIDIS
jgi:hypothetical protein